MCFPYLDDSFRTRMLGVYCGAGFIAGAIGVQCYFEKCSLCPDQMFEFLGFIINTVKMTVSLPDPKKKNVLNMCELGLTEQVYALDVFFILYKL